MAEPVQVILDVADGVVRTGFRRLLRLDGHIGDTPVLALVESKRRERFPDLQVRALGWWDVSPRVVAEMYADSIEGTLRSFHANDGATSAYMSHAPGLVHLELAADEPADYQRPASSCHSRRLTESGCVGRPRAATAEKGILFAELDLDGLRELRGLRPGMSGTHDFVTIPGVLGFPRPEVFRKNLPE